MKHLDGEGRSQQTGVRHLAAISGASLSSGVVNTRGISRQSVLILAHELAPPASINGPMSPLSIGAAISSFQASSTLHLANYAESAAGFLGLRISHSFY